MSTTTKFTQALFLSLPIFGSPISCALAQQTVLPETVISATGLPTEATEVASSVTVITEEQIQRDQRRTLPDLLATVPGVNVVQTGGPGGQTSVFMRGTNADHVKVLIDGIEVNDPSQPKRQFDFGPLMTDDIERVEVLRGPQSGLYGADALGGVISITTKTGLGPPKWTATMETGSFGTLSEAVQVSGGTPNSHYAFTAAHSLIGSTPVTPLEILAPGERRNNDWYNNYTYSGKVGADLSDIFSVNFVGRYNDMTLRTTNDDFSAFPFVMPFADRSIYITHQFNGSGEALWKLFDGRFNNRLGIQYTDFARASMDPNSPWQTFDGERTKYYWRSDLALAKGQTLLMGVERAIESGRTVTAFGGLSGSNGNTGAYAELQSAFSDRFFVASNIRHDDNDTFGGHNTWRLAPAFLIPETQTKLKASYGTGFHAPSLNQLFDPLSGNPALKPEQSRGYDFGFEQSLWQKRVTFGATWFRNDVENLITFASAFPFQFMNINRAKTHGIEAFAALQVTDRFQIRADYTYTIALDAVTGDPLQRRPKDKTSVSAVWQPSDQWTLSATAIWVSGWYDFDRFGLVFPAFLTSSYKIFNLAANYKIDENVTLFGRIDNLFNEHYQNPIGFERPGFGIFGGIRLTK
jgi:vitamin B12 transporter